MYWLRASQGHRTGLLCTAESLRREEEAGAAGGSKEVGSALTRPGISSALPPETGSQSDCVAEPHRVTVWQSLDLKLVPSGLFFGFVPHALDSC